MLRAICIECNAAIDEYDDVIECERCGSVMKVLTWEPLVLELVEEVHAEAEAHPERKQPQYEATTSGEPTDCYIEIWKDKYFEGDCLRLDGPAQYPNLRLGTEDWGDQIGSLRVGPNAFVLAYEDADFKDNMITLGPGQSIADLSELNFNDQIDSMRIIDSLRIFHHPPQESGEVSSGSVETRGQHPQQAQKTPQSVPSQIKGRRKRKRL